MRFQTFHNQSLKLISLTLLLMGEPALAQINTPSPDNTLGTIVVTVSREEQRLREVSNSVTVIGEEEIQRADVETLPELLKSHGIEINDKGAGTGSSEVVIRGFSTNSNPNESGTVLILLDGRRIGNSNIGYVPLQNIARVEVIRGAASVQYGSEATGGVINLISKRGSGKPGFALEQGFGSYDIRRTRIALSGSQGNFDYSFSGSHSRSGDFDVGGDKGAYGNTGTKRRTQGGVNLGLTLAPNHRIGLVAITTDGTYGRAGAFTEGKPALTPEGRSIRTNHSWDLSYDGALPEHHLSWKARYFKGKTTYETATNWKTRTGYYHYTSSFTGTGIQATWNGEPMSLTIGVDYYDVDQTKTTTPPPTASYDNSSAYLLAKVPLLDDQLWLTGGVRHDRFELKSGAVDQKKSRDTYSLGAAWLPVDWLKLRANAATSFKMPEPTHIAYRPGSTTYLANPDISPESSKSWEFGTDASWRHFDVALTYFNIDYKDKIESELVAPATRQYRNLPGTTEYRGWEGSLKWAANRTFGWKADVRPYLGFTRMLRFQNNETGNKTSDVADLSLSYGVAYSDANAGWRGSLDMIYYGKRYAHYTLTDRTRYGGQTVVNFHITKDLYRWGDHRLSLKVDVTNLTNRFYETLRNYPEAGRVILTSLRYEY
jgi:vitamin B12 transporter